jgi:AraC-like DNA-binding protein
MPEENETRTTHALLLQNDLPTPLGVLRLSGIIIKGRGVETMPAMRVYGRYAVVCILRGTGRYTDIQGNASPLRSGDVILVFPEIGHVYGPRAGESWDEIYLTFEGPVFDLWRQTGLLSRQQPILSIPDLGWPGRLRALVEEPSFLTTSEGRLSQLSRFLVLLGELVKPRERPDTGTPLPEWVVQSQGAMDINLGMEIAFEDVAGLVGMSYETFRKRFLKATGVTPVRYRLQRRIAAACELLRYSPQMTNRQAAETLGFADEFHFSKRFTQVTGMTPRAFRQNR